MKKLLFFVVTVLISSSVMAQSLEKMQRFNEPEKWEIKGESPFHACNAPERLLAHFALRFHRR
jgi:hypothetical protein